MKRKLVSFCLIAALLISLLPVHMASAAAAPKAEPTEISEDAANRNFAGADNRPYPMTPDDVVGSHFSIAADATFVGVGCPSWSNNIGNLTVSLYAFNKDYNTSVSAAPIATHEFVDYEDNAFLGFSFTESDPLKAGEYVVQISDAVPDEATGGVGVWVQQEFAGQVFYEDGERNAELSLRMSVVFINEPETPYGTLTGESAEGGEGGDINYTPYLDAILKFSDEDAEFYYTMDNAMYIDSLEITDEGYLAVEVIPGNDPQFYLEIPSWIDGPSREDYPVMLIRMKQTAGNILNGEIFFSTTEFAGPTAGGNVVVNYEKTNDWQNVIVNFKSNKNFQGMLQRMRFDIIGETTEDCSYLIDYILFFESVDAAKAFKHEDLETILSSRPTPEPATPTPEPTPTPTAKPTTAPTQTQAAQTAAPTSDNTQTEEGGLSSTEIIIIVVCAVLVVAAAVIITVILRKKKKNAK